MDKISEARTAITEAEAKVRGLIEKAAREGRYEELPELVELAQALGQLGGRRDEGGTSAPTSAPPATAAPSERPRKFQRGRAGNYPRFEIEGDRLVKIGWSKKEREEYEHKAPRESVLAVYLALGIAKKAFRMEDFLPVMADGDSADVPSYQCYLSLAWLRSTGQIRKLGKDSYRWAVDTVSEASFAAAWNDLPRRKD